MDCPRTVQQIRAHKKFADFQMRSFFLFIMQPYFFNILRTVSWTVRGHIRGKSTHNHNHNQYHIYLIYLCSIQRFTKRSFLKINAEKCNKVIDKRRLVRYNYNIIKKDIKQRKGGRLMKVKLKVYDGV